LKQRAAVITGAGGGIGLACARALAARGDRLVLGEVDPERLATAARSLEGAGLSVVGVRCDVSDAGGVRRLADAAAAAGSSRVVTPPTSRPAWPTARASST
jgi:NAD(P)-dependent dehydrogenase (short-subunit alcohol dehydrogenase family)